MNTYTLYRLYMFYITNTERIGIWSKLSGWVGMGATTPNNRILNNKFGAHSNFSYMSFFTS